MADTNQGLKTPTSASIPHPKVERGDIVWPTVLFGIAVFAVFGASTWAYFVTEGGWLTLTFVIINTFTIYFGFTLIHEASHRNISRTHTWLNDGFGYLATLLFHGSYRQFVTIHMRHHAHVNGGDIDPDHFTAGPVSLKNAWRWSMAVYYYFIYYTREALYKPQNKFAILVPYFIIYSLYGIALLTGNFHHIVLIFGIPAVGGALLTIFLFDYYPHHPHHETGRYTNAQTYVGGFFADALSMMQNYHIIHHMWPAIPWYKYRTAYGMIREDLKARGHRESSYWKTLAAMPLNLHGIDADKSADGDSHSATAT